MANKAFQIDVGDNVATALEDISPGVVNILGDTLVSEIIALTDIPKGHKIALNKIDNGDIVVKYGVSIGRSIKDIEVGSWVHLHNMCSSYDERSLQMDVVTGVPKDMNYE